MTKRKTYSTAQLKSLIRKVHERNKGRATFMVNFMFMVNTQNPNRRYTSSVIDKSTTNINSWNKLKTRIIQHQRRNEKYQYTIPLLWDKRHITLLIAKNGQTHHMDSGYRSKYKSIYDQYLNGLADSLHSKFIRTRELDVEEAQGNANLCFTYLLEYYDRLVKQTSSSRIPSLKRLSRKKLSNFMESLGSGHGSKEVKYEK